MNALIRQVVVLAVLWAVCELLLPAGSLQQMVRITVSALVLTALLSTAGEVLQSRTPSQPLARQAAALSSSVYRHTVLRSAANQAAAYCERLASRAGYEADITVWLTEEGCMDTVELALEERTPLMTADALMEMLAQRLDIGMDQIRLVQSRANEP